MSVAESVTFAKNQYEEKCSLVDGNILNTSFMVREIHDKDTGANSSSNLIEKVENLDTHKDENGGKVDNFSTSEVSTMYEKTGVAQKEERMHTYEGMLVESHEALIEELERSLAFSRDGEDFSDEAENSGLSDALRHQMGSRKFMLRGKMNDVSRSDPHGRLIEELEMSFSDTEEPMGQHTAVADKVRGYEHDKNPQTLGAGGLHPSEEGISLFDHGNLKSGQSFHQENKLVDNGKEGKEECHIEDDRNENLVFADENIAGRAHGNEDLTVDGTGENEESHMEDENMAKCIHGNEHVAVADEDIAVRIHENEHGNDRQSMETENTNLCEGVISSFNAGHIKSEQSFQQSELLADGTKGKEEGDMEDGNMTNCVQEDSAAVASFSSLSNKRTQCKLPSFNKNKEQMPYRYRATQLSQGLSLDSEDFKSIRNFIELQMDGTSSSLSSANQGDLMHRTSNKFNNIVRHDRLKKMDELRDQLNRLSSQKDLEKRYRKGGLEYQQQSNSYDIEQHFQSVDADSISNSCALESYYGHGRSPRYQPPNLFSPTHTYTHWHFGHAQTSIPHNYDAWEFNSYYQSSYAESTILDHESLKSTYKEQKRVVRKHILRPLSGACPFTICDSCFNLVQMPSDIYISKAKIGKMQCSQCSKVLVLSFPALYQADAKTITDMAQQSNYLDYSIVTKNGDVASHSAECLTGCPISINEEHGASFTRSFSTQAGSSLVATQRGKKVSDSALHRLMGYDSASQLLRHSGVFDNGYELFKSMVPVSSRVSRRKNM